MDDTTIAQDVLTHLMDRGVQLSDDPGQVEQAVLDEVRLIGAQAMELHLGQQNLGYEGSSRACPCGRTQRFVGHRPKQMATLLGSVTVRRAYYHCLDCGASSLPYDERVGLGDGQVSPGLAKSACLLAVQVPFATAAQLLHELTGQRVSERTVERLTHQAGRRAAADEEQQAVRMADWKAPDPEVQPERLYVAVDGTMVHEEDGWHEAKTVTCYWDDPDGLRQARYTVRFESAVLFAAYVWALACRCGLQTAKEVILLGDGARWIWDHIARVLDHPTQIVDWFHALEHVWDGGRKLYGEGTRQTEAWVKSIEALLWDGNVRGILARLEDEQTRARAPNDVEALQSLMTYLRNQDDRLAYDRFRACGLDIGSGRVEAACKSVVGARMKRGGMCWSRTGAQATLSLRVQWLNGTWDQFWETRPLAA